MLIIKHQNFPKIALLIHKVLFAIKFGEMDISPLTVGILVGITILMFAAVGISTLRLFQFDAEEKEPKK